MKILLAAPEDNTVLGIIARHSVKALAALGHDVRVFDFRQKPYDLCAPVRGLKNMVRSVFPSLPSLSDVPAFKAVADEKMNGLLLKTVLSFKPCLFLAYCGETITVSTIEEVKAAGIVTANWFHDSLIYPGRKSLVRDVLPAYDHCFIVDDLEVLQSLGVSFRGVSTLPLACDPGVHRRIDLSPDESKKYASDVAFVGTVTPRRRMILEALSDFDLAIWGVWPERSPKLKNCYRSQHVCAEEAAKIYSASKIIIDMHSLFENSASIKGIYNVTPRVFEVPACGGFLLTNNIPQLARLYEPEKEMAVYDDLEGLRVKIKYFLSHEQERARMAGRACDRARREHTYTQRLQKLIDVVLSGISVK